MEKLFNNSELHIAMKNKNEQEIKQIISPDDRWEKGVKHDSRSIEIFKFIKEYDFEFCGDWFCWKSGGDGDNGEQLMYELDEYYANKDLEEE